MAIQLEILSEAWFLEMKEKNLNKYACVLGPDLELGRNFNVIDPIPFFKNESTMA